MTKGLALEVDLLARSICQVASILERSPQRGDVDYAAAVGEDLTVLLTRTGVIDGNAIQRLGILDTGDDLAFLIGARIAGRSENHRDGPVVAPGEFDFIQALFGTGEHDVHQVVLQTGQDNLRLRVAKACIELQNLGARGGKHESAVQAAAIIDSLAMELLDGLVHDGNHGLMLLGCHDGHGTIDAHATRVGTEVALKGALVVLRGSHGTHGDAIGECQQGALGAGEHLLDDHRVAGLAKSTGEALVHGVESLLELGSNDDALTSGKAIGLDHERSTLGVHVVKSGLLVGKRAVGGGRHARALHQLLGKKLGALHLRALGTRTKARDACLAYSVGHAHDKRGLGADHDHTAAMFLGKRSDSSGVVLVERDVLALLRSAAVARCDIELAAALRSSELLGDSVLTASRTQKQDVDDLGICVH